MADKEEVECETAGEEQQGPRTSRATTCGGFAVVGEIS